MISLFSTLIIYSFFQLSNSSEKYRLEELESQARGFHSWHTTTAGSSYNLGKIEYTPVGIMRKMPASLVVTFFRPFLWETRNAVMLVSALESLFLLYLCIYALFRLDFKGFRKFDKRPYILGFFVFCLLFGFVIGFTSYNFGALMRYKIPISSLIFFIMFLIVYRPKKNLSPDQ